MKSKASCALIMHPKDVNEIHRFVDAHRDKKPQRQMSDHLLKTLFDWCPPIKLADFAIESQSSSGAIARGYCLCAIFLPEMLLHKRDVVLRKIEDALRECEENGTDIATLAAFNSIADGRQGAHVARVVRSMAVTNGSTYTSAMVIEALNRLSRRIGIDLKAANMAVIGASGSIGRLCSRYFMGKIGQLTLTGTRMAKLKRLFATHQGLLRVHV